MANTQGSSIINIDHFNQLASQIRSVEDCEAIRVVMREHLNQITGLVTSIIGVQADQLSNILPILKLPSPDPVSIVKWLGKLVLGTAYPQMIAYINYTLQLVMLASSVVTLTAAAAHAAENIKRCALEVPQELEAETLNALHTQVTDAISSSLSQVSNIQTLIQTTTNLELNFDTSSPEALTQSVQNGLDIANQLVNDYMNAEPEPPPVTESVEETVRRILAEKI